MTRDYVGENQPPPTTSKPSPPPPPAPGEWKPGQMREELTNKKVMQELERYQNNQQQMPAVLYFPPGTEMKQIPPYWFVTWRTGTLWKTEFRDSKEEALKFGAELSNERDTKEVRVMGGTMLARWGPEDKGAIEIAE